MIIECAVRNKYVIFLIVGQRELWSIVVGVVKGCVVKGGAWGMFVATYTVVT